MVKSVVVIGHPRPFIYAILADFERYPEWVPGCEACAPVSANANVFTVEITLNIAKRITFGLRFDTEKDLLLRFDMVSGTDLQAYRGSHKLLNSTDGKGTVLITELHLDAGAMAPKFFIERVVEKSLAATGEALRKYADTKASGSPPGTIAPAQNRGRKFRRPKCLLRIVKTEAGEEIWFAGRKFRPF